MQRLRISQRPRQGQHGFLTRHKYPTRCQIHHWHHVYKTTGIQVEPERDASYCLD